MEKTCIVAAEHEQSALTEQVPRQALDGKSSRQGLGQWPISDVLSTKKDTWSQIFDTWSRTDRGRLRLNSEWLAWSCVGIACRMPYFQTNSLSPPIRVHRFHAFDSWCSTSLEGSKPRESLPATAFPSQLCRCYVSYTSHVASKSKSLGKLNVWLSYLMTRWLRYSKHANTMTCTIEPRNRLVDAIS